MWQHFVRIRGFLEEVQKFSTVFLCSRENRDQHIIYEYWIGIYCLKFMHTELILNRTNILGCRRSVSSVHLWNNFLQNMLDWTYSVGSKILRCLHFNNIWCKRTPFWNMRYKMPLKLSETKQSYQIIRGRDLWYKFLSSLNTLTCHGMFICCW